MLIRKNTITINAPTYIDGRISLKNLIQSLRAEDQKLLFAIPNDISPYFGSFYWNTYSEEQIDALRIIVPALITAVNAFISERDLHNRVLASDRPAVINPISKAERGFAAQNDDEEQELDTVENHDLEAKFSDKSIKVAREVLSLLHVYDDAINTNSVKISSSGACCENGCDACCVSNNASMSNNWLFWYWMGYNNGQTASSHHNGNGHIHHNASSTCWGSCDAAFKALSTSLHHLFTFLSQSASNCSENVSDVAGSYLNTASSAASSCGANFCDRAGGYVNTVGNVASNGVGVLGDVLSHGSDTVSRGVDALSSVASSGADTFGHVASSGVNTLSHVASNGVDIFGHVASSGVDIIGQATHHCDGCGACLACCFASNGDTPPPICGIPILGLFGLFSLKPPVHSTAVPTCSPTFAPANFNDTISFAVAFIGQLYDFSKHSPVANYGAWVYFFTLNLMMTAFLLAHAGRAADNLYHNRAPRHTLQNILLVAIAAGLAGWGAHCMGYEMKTSIAWEITAMSFVDQLFTWWTLNHAYQKSFTLTCAQFNAALKDVKKDYGYGSQDLFPVKLGQAINENYVAFMGQYKVAENTSNILKSVYRAMNPALVYRFNNKNQNDLQSRNSAERQAALAKMYKSELKLR